MLLAAVKATMPVLAQPDGIVSSLGQLPEWLEEHM